jgi:hypothetical protein
MLFKRDAVLEIHTILQGMVFETRQDVQFLISLINNKRIFAKEVSIAAEIRKALDIELSEGQINELNAYYKEEHLLLTSLCVTNSDNVPLITNGKYSFVDENMQKVREGQLGLESKYIEVLKAKREKEEIVKEFLDTDVDITIVPFDMKKLPQELHENELDVILRLQGLEE